MTAAYDLFVRELNSTGREYGDGFSFIDPLELTPEERVKARDALRACIAREEERAPKALALLEPGADTLALLQTLFQAASHAPSPSEFDIAIAGALAYLMDAPVALDLLERTAVGDDEMGVNGAAMEGLITAHEASDASARLARQVRTQTDENVMESCADGLLQRHGFRLWNTGTHEQALALLDDLMSEDTSVRDTALQKVLQTPIPRWPWID